MSRKTTTENLFSSHIERKMRSYQRWNKYILQTGSSYRDKYSSRPKK